MNITFLGQGFLPDANAPVGEYLMKFLMDEDFHSFTGFSAFASEAGVVGLSDHFKKAKEKFENLTLIVGVDQKGTSKEALDAILDLDISAHIFYQLSFPIFHPKIYLFEGKHRTELIIGSSNLTTQGMFINVEASLLVSIDNGVEDDRKVVDELKAYFNGLFELSDPNLQPLTVELIEELVAQKVVPAESERKQLHDKQEQQEKLFKNIQVKKTMANDNATQLFNKLFAIRDKIILSFQQTFDEYYDRSNLGKFDAGICFEIAYELIAVVYSELNNDNNLHYGMHVYSDNFHSFIVVYDSADCYKVDYPFDEFEHRTTFNDIDTWHLRMNYIFVIDKLVIEKMDRANFIKIGADGTEFLKYGEATFEVMEAINGTYADIHFEIK